MLSQQVPEQIMKKLFMLTCITIFSWIGWWAGSMIGFMSSYIFSVIGGMIGVYIAFRLKNYME
jgi:predicted membrane chloride channel (bestrophin family)